MGKLSADDWRAVDRELRGEAIEILRELDRLEGRPPTREATPGSPLPFPRRWKRSSAAFRSSSRSS